MRYAICAIIKDEQLYLKEWIDYCLNIGFTDIYLYEDINSKSHLYITNNYSNVKLFQYNESQMSLNNYNGIDAKQLGLFYYFIKTYQNVFDWVAFIDPDEFIEFENGYSLEKLCDDFKDYHSIYLTYKIYGANNNIKRPTGGLLENYTSVPLPYKKWKTNHKSLVNLSFIDNSFTNVHHARHGVYTDYKKRYYLSNFNKDLCYDKAWINHYFTKSWEDWIERFTQKGDVAKGNRKISEFFIYNKDLFDIISKDKLKVKIKYTESEEANIINNILTNYKDAIIYFYGDKMSLEFKRLLNHNAIWWYTLKENQ